MIIGLRDQLPHLADRVLSASRHEFCDERDLRPDNDAVFIAKVVEFLRVLIMRKPQRVGADVFYDFHVFLHHGGRQRVSGALPVLMAGYAAKRIGSAV